MTELPTTIKLLYGDVESLYMPLDKVEELFGPFGADGISSRDYRFKVVVASDAGDFEFEGDISDWRLTLLEISMSQKLTDLENNLSRDMEMILSHVKRIRCDLEMMLDPQRGVITSDDTK